MPVIIIAYLSSLFSGKLKIHNRIEYRIVLALKIRTQGRDDFYEKNVCGVLNNGTCPLDLHHLTFLKTPAPLNQFCAYKKKKNDKSTFSLMGHYKYLCSFHTGIKLTN